MDETNAKAAVRARSLLRVAGVLTLVSPAALVFAVDSGYGDSYGRAAFNSILALSVGGVAGLIALVLAHVSRKQLAVRWARTRILVLVLGWGELLTPVVVVAFFVGLLVGF